MGAKRKLPQAGDIVSVVSDNDVRKVYYYDGNNLIDSKGTMFGNEKVDWNELWETDKSWRFATSDEKTQFRSELWKNNFLIDVELKKILSANKDEEEPKLKDDAKVQRIGFMKVDGAPFEERNYGIHTTIDAYKAELVRLYELLDDIDFMAQLGKFVDNETLLTMIRTKCNRRKRFIKDKGRDLFFNGDKLTDYQKEDNDE